MSKTFTVDVVATPQLDLCGSAAGDLSYYRSNGRFPTEARSRLAREQEKLNTFLRYVNESFIIKGFSRAASRESTSVQAFASGNSAPILLRETEQVLGSFEISHGDNAHLLLLCVLTGEAAASGESGAVLEVSLRENGTAVQTLHQSISGQVTFAVPALLPSRAAGKTQIEMAASVSGGEICLEKGSAYAYALVTE